MESERFDALVRAIDVRAPRRAVLSLVGGGLVALLMRLGVEDVEAKKRKPNKKKKKTCRSGTKMCGTACIPANDCCTNASCGEDGACIQGACVCVTRFRDCQGTCIPESGCCTSADCPAGSGKICQNHVCACTEPFRCAENCCLPGQICAIVNNVLSCLDLVPVGGACNPEIPEQCVSGKCGCNGLFDCTCRNADCVDHADVCGSILDCCQGFCPEGSCSA